MEVQKLKNLKKDWGHEVYEALITTLSKSNRWNPSGSYEVEKHRKINERGRLISSEAQARYHLKQKWQRN